MPLVFGETTRCYRCKGTTVYNGRPCSLCGGRGVLGLPEPTARQSDPTTSHAAAASVPPRTQRRHHELVLLALRAYGPMDDEELVRRLHNYIAGGIAISPSGARTRRAELVRMGLVRDSGRKTTLASGRHAIVWELEEPDALDL